MTEGSLPSSASERPDPDALLADLQRKEAAAQRGKLKIFFGACAGVGKTYAMLAQAQAQRTEGRDVLIGVVETHGRAETMARLDGLEMLPRRQQRVGGAQVSEFDLDAALARKPSLLLVDELAHSNVVGSRHDKRWQDVEELLAAGIDVWTAVNVQHLESLNDIVGQITGIRVRETVPDRFFDAADEVSLVDLPPDELLRRLQAGKVYLPQQAARASRNFFRKGNLLALRELALRRTADRVDAQMQAYRSDRAIQPVWQARDRLLVCIGPGGGHDRLVRSAARLAGRLQADWLAVYVETPSLLRLSETRRQDMLKALRLAQTLGAETSVLAGSDLAQTLLAYARSRNVSKLVVGTSRQKGWSRLWQPPLSERLARAVPDIDIYLVSPADASPAGEASLAQRASSLLFDTPGAGRGRKRRGLIGAVLATAVTTALAAGLLNVFDLANVVMVYLLSVVLIAIRYGRNASVLASFLSVLAFDFFFVEPRLSLSVSDSQYLFTFAMLLVVALVISQLAARSRFEARVARYRERRTRALFELGRELAGALTVESVLEISERQLAPLFQARLQMFVANDKDELPDAEPPAPFDLGVARWVFSHQEPAGQGTQTLPGSAAYYLPLKAPMRVRGVLALLPESGVLAQLPEQQRLLEACASQIALSLERVHFIEVAQQALVAMSAERLRNGVLSAVSHDLRTPLTTLGGLVEMLDKPGLDEAEHHDLVRTVQREISRLGRQVGNLLEMARLQSGVTLNREWQLIDEVIGAALSACESLLSGHRVVLALAPNLPMVRVDAVLMERVLVNLLENAAKYTPPGSTLTLAAVLAGDQVRISLRDDGPGLPPGSEEQLFEKFARGRTESTTPGVGLGLAICRAIVLSHGGRLWATRVEPQGAEFCFTLPVERRTLPDEVTGEDACG